MGMTIEDNIKQKLLDSLSKEPKMVLETAYVYAKNHVQYGEDVTKAWTTAVQQASILEQVRRKARAEAYDSFKKDYENRLKADMVAMLTELKKEIDDLYFPQTDPQYMIGRSDCLVEIKEDIIQQKIDALKKKVFLDWWNSTSTEVKDGNNDKDI